MSRQGHPMWVSWQMAPRRASETLTLRRAWHRHSHPAAARYLYSKSICASRHSPTISQPHPQLPTAPWCDVPAGHRARHIPMLSAQVPFMSSLLRHNMLHCLHVQCATRLPCHIAQHTIASRPHRLAMPAANVAHRISGNIKAWHLSRSSTSGRFLRHRMGAPLANTEGLFSCAGLCNCCFCYMVDLACSGAAHTGNSSGAVDSMP